MKTIRWLSIIALLQLNTALANNEGMSDGNSLRLTPSKCITLKEGKLCYEDVDVAWNALQKGNYCLFSNKMKSPIKCWKNVKSGHYSFEFRQSHSLEYTLLNMSNQQLMAKQHFSVKWVYKNRPNNSWRLF